MIWWIGYLVLLTILFVRVQTSGRRAPATAARRA